MNVLKAFPQVQPIVERAVALAVHCNHPNKDELIKAIAQANPNLVTIMVVGAPVDLRTVNDCTKGLLISWFNGSEGGHALADVLTGVPFFGGNPALAITFSAVFGAATLLNVVAAFLPHRG